MIKRNKAVNSNWSTFLEIYNKTLMELINENKKENNNEIFEMLDF